MARKQVFFMVVKAFFFGCLWRPICFAVSSTAAGKVHGPGLMARGWGMLLMIEAKSKEYCMCFCSIEAISAFAPAMLRTAACLKHAGALQLLQRLALLNLFADAESLDTM